MSSDAVENEHTGELAWCFARRPGLSPGAGRPAETKAQRAAARPWRDARADQAARCVEVEARVVDAGGAVTSRLDARASASARRDPAERHHGGAGCCDAARFEPAVSSKIARHTSAVCVSEIALSRVRCRHFTSRADTWPPSRPFPRSSAARARASIGHTSLRAPETPVPPFRRGRSAP